jgi:hypothetical protein
MRLDDDAETTGDAGAEPQPQVGLRPFETSGGRRDPRQEKNDAEMLALAESACGQNEKNRCRAGRGKQHVIPFHKAATEK